MDSVCCFVSKQRVVISCTWKYELEPPLRLNQTPSIRCTRPSPCLPAIRLEISNYVPRWPLCVKGRMDVLNNAFLM